MLGLERKGTLIDARNSYWERLIEWGVTILLYVTGGILICAGELTIGAVFAFVSYSSYVMGPVSSLINLKMYFARIFPSAKRLFQFLDMDVEEDTGTTLLGRFPPRLEFKDVEFSYAEGRTILQGVNFYVEPGEKVAIIGQNGSGKSTILNLLLRFYEPEKGIILQDGTDIRDVPPWIIIGNYFPWSARNHICFWEVSWKTPIRQAGQSLKTPPILILDEVTSSCDVESDAYLHEVLIHQTTGKSVIMITHHYENLDGMDRIYRLQDGRLVQQ